MRWVAPGPPVDSPREGPRRRVWRSRARAGLELTRSPRLDGVHAAPGNPGIARLGECHPVRAEDGEGLLALAGARHRPRGRRPRGAARRRARRRAPARGLAVFGPAPRRLGSRLEGFAKDVMDAAGVPTAARSPVARPPCVVKADGLAAGKGVFVCRTQQELDEGLRAAAAPAAGRDRGAARRPGGLALRARRRADAVALAPAQDFKRIGDGDQGPNTGGMGAYSPVPGSARRSTSSSTGPPARARRARAPRRAVRRVPFRRPDADRRMARACSSSTAASATPRPSRSCRGSRAICSRPSPPLPRDGSTRLGA